MIKKVFAIFLVIAIFLSFLLVPVACKLTAEDWEEMYWEEMAMEDAIDVVVEDILPTIPEIQQGGLYVCLKLDAPLPEGTIIEEGSGSTLKIKLEEEKFFFYLDLAPGCFYAHPVKYILVDLDLNYEVHDANWWPLIDGDVPEGLGEFPPPEVDVVDGNIEGIFVSSGTHFLGDIEPLSRRGEGFIVVQGLTPDDPLTHRFSTYITHVNALFFFEKYRNIMSPCPVDLCTPELAAGVLDTISELAEFGLNPITIFIIAYGYEDWVLLGGVPITANDFCNVIETHSNTIFNFIIASSHSGSFIDNLQALDNVCVVVTACEQDQATSIVDLDEGPCGRDINEEDMGSEWSSSLLWAMWNITMDPARWNKIEYIARTSFSGLMGPPPPETSVLIYEASYVALGDNRTFREFSFDLDYGHRCGLYDPCRYCSYTTTFPPGPPIG